MPHFDSLKTSITNAIKTNGNQEITGKLLSDTLVSIVNNVGAHFLFAGVAEPATNPGTIDAPVFFLASKPGTYVNFSGINIKKIGLYMLVNNSVRQTWNILEIPELEALFEKIGDYSSLEQSISNLDKQIKDIVVDTNVTNKLVADNTQSLKELDKETKLLSQRADSNLTKIGSLEIRTDNNEQWLHNIDNDLTNLKGNIGDGNIVSKQENMFALAPTFTTFFWGENVRNATYEIPRNATVLTFHTTVVDHLFSYLQDDELVKQANVFVYDENYSIIDAFSLPKEYEAKINLAIYKERAKYISIPCIVVIETDAFTSKMNYVNLPTVLTDAPITERSYSRKALLNSELVVTNPELIQFSRDNVSIYIDIANIVLSTVDMSITLPSSSFTVNENEMLLFYPALNEYVVKYVNNQVYLFQEDITGDAVLLAYVHNGAIQAGLFKACYDTYLQKNTPKFSITANSIEPCEILEDRKIERSNSGEYTIERSNSGTKLYWYKYIDYKNSILEVFLNNDIFIEGVICIATANAKKEITAVYDIMNTDAVFQCEIEKAAYIVVPYNSDNYKKGPIVKVQGYIYDYNKFLRLTSFMNGCAVIEDENEKIILDYYDDDKAIKITLPKSLVLYSQHGEKLKIVEEALKATNSDENTYQTRIVYLPNVIEPLVFNEYSGRIVQKGGTTDTMLLYSYSRIPLLSYDPKTKKLLSGVLKSLCEDESKTIINHT